MAWTGIGCSVFDPKCRACRYFHGLNWDWMLYLRSYVQGLENIFKAWTGPSLILSAGPVDIFMAWTGLNVILCAGPREHLLGLNWDWMLHLWSCLSTSWPWLQDQLCSNNAQKCAVLKLNVPGLIFYWQKSMYLHSNLNMYGHFSFILACINIIATVSIS